MVKPGGTGKPRLAISARLAPLPPRRSRRPALPSALPSPKVKTHLPALGVSVAAGFAGVLAGVFATCLAGLFLSAFRAVATAAGFARDAADGFDFAEVFLSLAAALAMAFDQSAGRVRGKRKLRALHHFGRARARRRVPDFGGPDFVFG